MFTHSYKNIFLSKKTTCVIIIIALIIFSTTFLFWKKFINTDSISQKSYLFQSIEYEKITHQIDLKKFSTLIKANDFIEKNNNVYGTFTAMFLAKKYILNNQLEPALKQLKNNLKLVKDENLKNILLFRIAKIESEENKNQEAISTLENIKDHNWNSIIENTKGDIFLLMNKKEEAITAWKKIQFNENSDASKTIIDMKIQALKIK